MEEAAEEIVEVIVDDHLLNVPLIIHLTKVHAPPLPLSPPHQQDLRRTTELQSLEGEGLESPQ